jgi:hypothetical protein
VQALIASRESMVTEHTGAWPLREYNHTPPHGIVSTEVHAKGMVFCMSRDGDGIEAPHGCAQRQRRVDQSAQDDRSSSKSACACP